MTIRQLQEQDIARCTQIAQRAMEHETINEQVIREKTVDARRAFPDLGLVYELDGRVIAFAQGSLGKIVEDKQRSHIRLICVDPPHRRKGIASALLAEIETRLKARGAHILTIMDDPFSYFMPGVDFRNTAAYCFLEKHKFAFYRENHNLLCKIDVNAWPELDGQIARLAEENVEIRRAQATDAEAINVLLRENWPSWSDEVQSALENSPPTLFIARHDGRTIAFSGYQGNNRSLNWFGPMGTLPVLRGKGIGGILLRLCLRELARQGFTTAIIPWVGPVRFYEKLCGAWIDRCFWAWQKEL
jgi:predicted N-acetyltransferase YhbS